MLPLWNKYPNHANDIWDSIALFLEGYAFERQGKRPDYSPASVDALFQCKSQNKGNLTPNAVNDVWHNFSKLLKNERLNQMNNPLYPRLNPQKKSSLIEIVFDSDIPQKNLTFTTYFQNLIKHNNDIQPVFNVLRSIRGIRDKIPSLYLRDLVDVMGINLKNTQNRYLLQPIDIWVERTIKALTENQNMSKRQVSNWITATSVQQNINPERVNMGIWFLCSNIIKSEYSLNAVLTNKNGLIIAQKLIDDFRDRIRGMYTIAS
jgi:hypothetical protein